MAPKAPENQLFEFFATCLPGAEALLADELKRLHCRSVRPLKGGVAFFGAPLDAQRVCLWSRLAGNVTVVMGRVGAADADELYRGVRQLPWATWLPQDTTVSVSAKGTNEALRNSQFTALKVKDALCDCLMDAWGKRPAVDAAAAKSAIEVRLRDSRATVSLNLSGATLHRRGYLDEHDGPDAPRAVAQAAAKSAIEVRLRDSRATVSLNLSGATLHRRGYLDEHDGPDAPRAVAQAAALLALAGWERLAEEGFGFCDPSCNQGLLLCEAGLTAAGCAPGISRDQWGFFGWAKWDAEGWEALLAEADQRFEVGLAPWSSQKGSEAQEPIASSRDIAEASRCCELQNSPIQGGKGFSGKAAEKKPQPRLLGTAASSPSVARSRVHVRRAGLGCMASVLFDEGASEVSSLSMARARQGAADGRMLVAWMRPADHSMEDARARAEENVFAQACRAVADGSLFACAAESDLEALLGSKADKQLALFAGEQRSVLSVREGKISPLATIMVPDPSGGAEHQVAVYDQKSGQFAARLAKSARARRKWARREDVSCYRVYDRDLPEYSCSVDLYHGAGQNEGKLYAVVAEYAAPKSVDAAIAQQRFSDVLVPEYSCSVDLYHGAGQNEGKLYAVVAEYAAPKSVDAAIAQQRFSDVLALVPPVLGIRPDHVFSKVRSRAKGGSQYATGGRRGYEALCAEIAALPANSPLRRQLHSEGMSLSPFCSGEECLFKVDFAARLDTGLFLDHRLTRQLVGSLAKGKSFLNLFAYTGTATVHAARGGASSTTTVDLSQTYLEWAGENLRLNGFDGEFAERPTGESRGQRGRGERSHKGGRHQLVRADVLQWITQARREGRRFDIIFVDPPTFSNSKAMGQRSWDVQRDHVELLISVSRLLSKDGLAVFSCNLKNFKPDFDQLARYGVELQDITALTIPEDFSRTPNVHHCYLVRRVHVTGDMQGDS